MADQSRSDQKRTQAKTNRNQANELKDDGFDADPEVARAVGGDRAADDTKTDPDAKPK